MAGPARRSPAPPQVAIAVCVGMLLVLGLVVAAIRPPWQFDPIAINLPRPTLGYPTLPGKSHSATPSPAHLRPPAPGPDLSWIKWVLLSLAIAAVAITIALVAMRLLAVRQMYASRPDDEIEITDNVAPDLPTMHRGAVTAQERLLAIGNPTDAIIAAWLALEEAAEASGVRRRPSETPTEFTADVLGRTGAPAEPVRTLLGLYLRARFAARPSSADDLDTARRCVRELATNWRDFAQAEPPSDSGGQG